MPEQYYNPCGVMFMTYDNRLRKSELLDHVNAAEYTAILALDDQEFASYCDRPYNIFRSWTFEPDPDNYKADPAKGKSAARVAAEAVYAKVEPWSRQYPNTHILINNEQSFTKARLDMYAELIKLSAERSSNNVAAVSFVFGNFASGSIACGQGVPNIVDAKTGAVIHTNDCSVLPTQTEIERGWREINDWYNKAEYFLRTMHDHRNMRSFNGSKAFVLGDHQYTTFTPWFSADGGRYNTVFNWKGRPKSIDWKLAQWHIGRTLQALMQCCSKWGITLPNYIVTECLFDTMNDVLNRSFTPKIELPAGIDKPRGYKTYVRQWPKWFPEFDTVEEALAEFTIWTWETVYAPLGNVDATITYTIGNTGDWGTFDLAESADGDRNLDDNEYIAIMEDYRYIAAPDEDEIDIPPDAGFAVKATLTLPAGVTAMNIRAGNGVLYTVKGVVPANAIIWHYSHVNRNGWTYVDYNGIRGWMSLQANGKPVTFVPIVTTPDPPAPDIDPALLALTGWYDASASAFAVGAVIYQYRDVNSRQLGFIKTANEADRVNVQTVFNPKLNPWRAIEFNNTFGWVRATDITFYPTEPALNLNAADDRFVTYAFTAKNDFKVYRQINIGAFHRDYINVVGEELVFGHLPTNLLDAVQQSVLNNRVDGEWLVVIWNGELGFLRRKDFTKVEKIGVPTEPKTVTLTLDQVNAMQSSFNTITALSINIEDQLTELRLQIEGLESDFNDATST